MHNACPVFRVEGTPNTRLLISDAGDVRIVGNQRLHLNFGDSDRALEFYLQRVAQGMPDVQLKGFYVADELLSVTQANGLAQRFGRLYPNAPQIVDVTKAANQFGFPASWFNIIESFIIPNSGRIILP